MRKFHNNDNSTCLIGGDLNEIFYHQEKSGDPQKNDSSLQSFRDSLDDGLLEDMGFLGPSFTWQGIRNGSRIWEKLGRFLNDAIDTLFLQMGIPRPWLV